MNAIHVHASDTKLSERGSAKFFVRSDESTVVKAEGTLKGHEITKIQTFIKEHYLDMYKTWSEDSSTDFIRNNTTSFYLIPQAKNLPPTNFVQ